MQNLKRGYRGVCFLFRKINNKLISMTILKFTKVHGLDLDIINQLK